VGCQGWYIPNRRLVVHLGSHGQFRKRFNLAANLLWRPGAAETKYAHENDKRIGALTLGPEAINTVWKGFGSPCEPGNSGYPIVLQELADWWLVISSSPWSRVRGTMRALRLL
jgi:hypothetical protein